jgi:hypothetical protein
MTTRVFIGMLMIFGVLWLGLVWGMVAWLSTPGQGDVSWSVLSVYHGMTQIEAHIPPSVF